MDDLNKDLFDYDSLDAETRQLVQQKADETHRLLKRTAESVLQIGENLKIVKEKLPYGQFLGWLQAEFGMSQRTAYNFIRVADTFQGRFAKFANLPLSILYELAASSTSDEIREQVASGQLDASLEAIKAAKEAERQIQEAARQESLIAQQQLAHERSLSSEQRLTIEQLTQDIALLQKQIGELSSPAGDLREVDKPVVSSEAIDQIKALQQEVHTLTEQRNQLVQQVERLGNEAKAAAMKCNEGEAERRIRLNWYWVTNEFRACMGKIMPQWPSPLDTQAFEAGDWTRLSQTRQLAERFLEECKTLSRDRVVESRSIYTEGTRERVVHPGTFE